MILPEAADEVVGLSNEEEVRDRGQRVALHVHSAQVTDVNFRISHGNQL